MSHSVFSQPVAPSHPVDGTARHVGEWKRHGAHWIRLPDGEAMFDLRLEMHMNVFARRLSWFDIAFELSRETVELCERRGANSLIAPLARMGAAIGRPEQHVNMLERIREPRVHEQEKIHTAISALAHLPPPLVNEAEIDAAKALLQTRVSNFVAYEATQPTKKQAKLVHRRYVLHAVANLMRRKGLEVKIAKDESPSLYIEVVTSFLSDLGIPGTTGAHAKQAAPGKASIRATLSGEKRSWEYASGGGGQQLGLTTFPFFPGYNSFVVYPPSVGGGYRVEFHCDSAPFNGTSHFDYDNDGELIAVRSG
jgi:hypothetical protein